MKIGKIKEKPIEKNMIEVKYGVVFLLILLLLFFYHWQD